MSSVVEAHEFETVKGHPQSTSTKT